MQPLKLTMPHLLSTDLPLKTILSLFMFTILLYLIQGNSLGSGSTNNSVQIRHILICSWNSRDAMMHVLANTIIILIKDVINVTNVSISIDAPIATTRCAILINITSIVTKHANSVLHCTHIVKNVTIKNVSYVLLPQA